MPRLTLTTSAQPGAIAVLQLRGAGVTDLLTKLTGRAAWPTGRVCLARFADIDEGVAVCLRDDWAQLMPHGGPRVVQKLIERLDAWGAVYTPAERADDLRVVYPEARSRIEADMLHAMATASSPAALNLLAAQPAAWRAWRDADPANRPTVASTSPLDALLTPPSVVVVGKPNIGKSTLTNRLLGRAAAIVADLPGTTRDWVAGLAELPVQTPAGANIDHVAVRWLDTPGLRSMGDGVEQEAIRLAQDVIASADVLIVMRSPDTDWPQIAALPKAPDVWVLNKCDEASDAIADEHTQKTPLRISAKHGHGVRTLQQVILARLGLTHLDGEILWAFSTTLRKVGQAPQQLNDYLATE